MPKHKPTKKDDTSDSDSGPEDRGPVKKSKPSTDAKSSTNAKSSNNRSGDDSELSWDLGKNRFVKLSEFKGKWYVNIREFYNAPDGELRPGKKGIMLTMEQWHKFKSVMGDLEEAIKTHI